MRKTFWLKVLTVCAVVTLLITPAMAGVDNGAGRKSFLWKVESKGATVYLLGSIHLAKAGLYPLPAKIEESFATAGVLALEADPAKASDPGILGMMLSSASYPEGETLRGHLSKETYDLASAEMNRLGLPMETFEKIRPWFLAMTMESLEFLRLGFDPAYGIDVHFANEAGQKRIVELESFDYQINMMNGFSDREQELFLLYTIKDLAGLREGIGELMTAWQRGDAKTVESLMTKSLSESPQLATIYEKLFYRRNREMTEKIVKFLQGRETIFVVVGAGHLVGKEGIIEILRRKGYSVKQM